MAAARFGSLCGALLFAVAVASPAQAAKVVEIASRDAFSIQLRDDGTVWSWGANDIGSLGDGTLVTRSTPVKVAGLPKIVAISAGSGHALALDSAGSVWAWGANGDGQVGDGTKGTLRSSPVRVIGLDAVTQISAGDTFSLALRRDGTVWSWGSNVDGQLGNGTKVDRATPGQVSQLGSVLTMSAGAYPYSHAVAVTNDGRVWTWGSNQYGQLGVPLTTKERLAPGVVAGLTGVFTVSAGGQFTLAVRGDGMVFAWGRNDNYQLGDGTTTDRATPVQLNLSGIGRIAAGRYTTSLALGGNGTAWGWGGNFDGQLGLDPSQSVEITPVKLTPPTSTAIASIAASVYHSLVLDREGRILSVGANYYGMLGIADVVETATPVRVPISGVNAVAAGEVESIALRADGTVWTWGDNFKDFLGGEVNFAVPTQVAGIGGSATAVSARGRFSTALRSDGTVWGWGEAVPGTDNFESRSAVRIAALSGVRAIATSRDAVLALGADGHARFACTGTCGATDFGFNDVVAVAAGYEHFIVVRADGSVWTLGANRYGQLGTGDTADSLHSPVRVGGLSNVKAVHAGDYYSVAVLGDGSVYLWGLPPDKGSERERYDVQSPTLLHPSRVAELTGAQQVSAYEHLVAVNDRGQGYAWGLASKVGERERPIPGRAVWMDGLKSIAAGQLHTIAVTPDGGVVAWGKNYYEQLGVARQQYSSTWLPVKDPLNQVYTQDAVPVVEFRNGSINAGHYFITAFADEAIALQNGTNAVGWSKTGRAWRAWLDQSSAPASAKPVYRFFSSRWNSHFYTANEEEKSTLVRNNPRNDPAVDWALEAVAFFSQTSTNNCPSLSILPRSASLCTAGQTPTGVDCSPGFYPVYRAWNQRADPNHRISANWIDVYKDVRFFGFVYEGVAFCSPMSSQSGGDLHAYNTYPGDAVSAGAPLSAEYLFTNAGPGSASGATMVAAMPSAVAWAIQCKAYHGAVCPPGLTQAALRDGVVIDALPAGGVLQLLITGTAPTSAQTLEYYSAIGAPNGAPDPYLLNNASAVSQTIVKSAAQCTLSVAPSALGVGASPASSPVLVDAPSGCRWTISSDQDWVTLNPPAGTGPGAITAIVSGNVLASDRVATLTVGATGQKAELALRQAGSPPPPRPCSLDLSRDSEQVGSNRITNFVKVRASFAECTWDVSSDVTWIVISSATRLGSGLVDYDVQPNSDPFERRGTLRIGAKQFTVIQAPPADAAGGDTGGGGDSGGDGGGSGGGDGAG